MTCQAIKERKDLTYQIALVLSSAAADQQTHAISLIQPLIERGEYGTEKGLVCMFSILHGVVNEYLDGGDQLTENCDCGGHQ